MKVVLLVILIMIAASVVEAGWGDVSMNGGVTPYDAALIMRHLDGDIVLPLYQLYYADVDANGVVTLRDAEYILLYYVRLIYLFPRHMVGWPLYIKYHPMIISLWYWDFNANPIIGG